MKKLLLVLEVSAWGTNRDAKGRPVVNAPGREVEELAVRLAKTQLPH
ncbi:hypothetical protein [Lentzea tibetensis]|nr:hypothetical protein [Lentzea tibetensis]